MKAVILAGGFGTRISEESYLRPKPMIEIGEQPGGRFIALELNGNTVSGFREK